MATRGYHFNLKGTFQTIFGSLHVLFTSLVLAIQILSVSTFADTKVHLDSDIVYPEGSKTAYETAFLQPGAVIQLRTGQVYTVSRELGRGNFGIVYLCLNMETNEPLAIKINFNPAYVYTPAFKSKYIIPISTQQVWIASEKGEVLPEKMVEIMPVATPLAKILESSMDTRGRMLLAHQVMNDLVTGLLDLNKYGYTHNDIKPGNILKFEGKYVLSDFGSAKKQDARKYAKGTIKRMAPEQFTSHENSFYSDIYQLSVTLTEVLFKEGSDFLRYRTLSRASGGFVSIEMIDAELFLNYLKKQLSNLESEDLRKFSELFEFLQAGLEFDVSKRTAAIDKIVQSRRNVTIRARAPTCQGLFF